MLILCQPALRLRAKKDKNQSKYVNALVSSPLKEVRSFGGEFFRVFFVTHVTLSLLSVQLVQLIQLQELWKPPFESKFVRTPADSDSRL